MTAFGRMTLRRRLVLATVALLTLSVLAIGVLTVVALRGFLVDRLDQQLQAATDRTSIGFSPTEGSPPPVTDLLLRPGQAEGTLGAVVRSGVVVAAGIVGVDGRYEALSDEAIQGLIGVRLDNEPQTITLEGVGGYRVAGGAFAIDGNTLLVGLPLDDVDDTVLRLSLLVGGIGLIGLVVVGVLGTAVIRGALRPLDRVAATATRVAELPLDRGEVALAERVSPQDADPSTEVGRVGAALNAMLEHVASALTARQASEQKVRTFVADASHELRTPLASIRGYAELTRRRDHDLPDDVRHAIGRVESESVRMTALVEDLLLLARLDDAPALVGDEVDLSALLVDAVSDAQAAGPDHEWVLELPDEPVLAHGDRARLTQVVANLLANARIHTPAGTTVTASARVVADTAVLEIADDGPGIDPGLVPTVFERFARGDGSRARATGGTGLGLAIVSAVVEAHRGRVELRSEPGDTVFRVVLPLTS